MKRGHIGPFFYCHKDYQYDINQHPITIFTYLRYILGIIRYFSQYILSSKNMLSDQFNKVAKALYKDGYRLAQELISKKYTNENLFEAVSVLYNNIDQILNQLIHLAHEGGTSIDCKAGCSYCCHQQVYAVGYELEYLNNYLVENLNNTSQNDVRERILSKRSKKIGLNENEINKLREPCPLLINKKCIAYKARPMACRIYLSTNLASCIDLYNKIEDEEHFPKVVEFALKTGRMLNEGFSAGLKTIGYHTIEEPIEDGLFKIFYLP